LSGTSPSPSLCLMCCGGMASPTWAHVKKKEKEEGEGRRGEEATRLRGGGLSIPFNSLNTERKIGCSIHGADRHSDPEEGRKGEKKGRRREKGSAPEHQHEAPSQPVLNNYLRKGKSEGLSSRVAGKRTKEKKKEKGRGGDARATSPPKELHPTHFQRGLMFGATSHEGEVTLTT